MQLTFQDRMRYCPDLFRSPAAINDAPKRLRKNILAPAFTSLPDVLKLSAINRHHPDQGPRVSFSAASNLRTRGERQEW